MESLASRLLRDYWDGNLPVNPDVIARNLGIEIRSQFGQGGYSGSIERQNDGRIVLTYDLTEPRVRQRFTIAHEIGHYVLGHLNHSTTMFRDTPSSFSTANYSPEETAANRFAADLLMPHDVLHYIVVVQKVNNVEHLANAFDVSQVAMRYRLQNLGYI